MWSLTECCYTCVLITSMLLFLDRCGLVNRDAVEQVQDRMLDCFRYVCKRNDMDFNRRFPAIIDKLISARELTEKFKTVVVSVVSCWKILTKYPLVREFFGGFKQT